MAYVILTRDNEPLADVNGKVFTFQARSDAMPFLMPGESIQQRQDDQPGGSNRDDQ